VVHFVVVRAKMLEYYAQRLVMGTKVYAGDGLIDAPPYWINGG
jgi:hypothetical protein